MKDLLHGTEIHIYLFTRTQWDFLLLVSEIQSKIHVQWAQKSTVSMNTFPCVWVNLNKQGHFWGNPYTMETLWLRILCHYSTCIRPGMKVGHAKNPWNPRAHWFPRVKEVGVTFPKIKSWKLFNQVAWQKLNKKYEAYSRLVLFWGVYWGFPPDEISKWSPDVAH